MRKKLTAVILIITVLTFLMASCTLPGVSSNKKAGKMQPEASMPDTLENDQINILVWTDIVKSSFDETVKIMEEKYGAKINFTMTTSEAMETTIFTSMSAGDAFDGAWWNQTHMPRYAVKGLLQPIDPYFDFNDPLFDSLMDSMNQFKYKEKYYGISEGPRPYIILYNKTIFENNGLKTPLEYYKEGKWDWMTLRELGKKLTQDTNGDGAVDQWGFYTNIYDMFITANGSDIVKIKDDGSIELNLKDPNVIEALQFYQDSLVSDAYSLRSLKFKSDFPAGKIAMVGIGLNGINNAIDANMKDEWDIAPFPAGPNGQKDASPGTCGFWGIPNGAKNPQGGAVALYYHQKTAPIVAIERCSESQTQLIKQISKKINIAKYPGVGNMKNTIGPFWNEIGKGTPVVSVIEKQIPVQQNEIDQMLKEGQ